MDLRPPQTPTTGTHDDAAAADPDTRATVAEWLSALYRDGENYWSGLQPDPLGEYLVATALSSTQLANGQLESTTAAVSAGQLERGLIVLGRAHPQHPHLTDIIITGWPRPAGAVKR